MKLEKADKARDTLTTQATAASMVIYHKETFVARFSTLLEDAYVKVLWHIKAMDKDRLKKKGMSWKQFWYGGTKRILRCWTNVAEGQQTKSYHPD